jgi:hypothetical protein
VEGIKPLRLLCHLLGLTQPRRLQGELRIPTLEELRLELLGRNTEEPVAPQAPSRLGGEKAAAESSNEDQAPAPEDEAPVCPYCGPKRNNCGHLFALIDETFATVTGPAEELFNDLACSDEDEGITSDDVDDFINACEASCGCCLPYYSEGGPGMSSHEYWCWSDDIPRDLAKLRAELGKRRRK